MKFLKELSKYFLLFEIVLSSPTKIIELNNYDVIDLSHFGNRLYGIPNLQVGDIVEEWYKSPNVRNKINPEELGSYAEGDILNSAKTDNKNKGLGRNGVISESYRWRDGIVPFEIRGYFSSQDLDLIRQAMYAYHQRTCIKFVPRQSFDTDYISIQDDRSGCWSNVGRSGGMQIVNLQSPGCVVKIGTVMHELAHAIGFMHEQNREERDGYVEIHLENAQKGTEINFEKAPSGQTSGFGVGYDYGSVMHYSANAFSVNGRSTIVPKQSSASNQMGQRDGFSPKDIQKINTMYKCNKGTSSATTGQPQQPDFGSAIGSIASAIAGGFKNMISPTHEDAEEISIK